MSHDTHGHHHEHQDEKPVVAFKAGFYFVLILAGLFIAAIAFVKSMSHDEGGHDAHGATHETHATHEGHDATGGHEATHEAAHETPAADGTHHEAAPAEQHAAPAEEAHH